MPKVSIIIPAFNAEKFLSEAIASVVLQTFKDWECIIVNDASTDHTLEIAERWKEYDKRIKIVSLEQNVGLPNARNEGVKVAQGEVLAFLDSDDIWHPLKLEQSLEYLEKHNVLAVLNSFFQFYDTTYKLLKRVLTPFLDNPFFSYEDLLMRRVRSAIPSSLVLKHELFLSIGGFSSYVPGVDDYDFLIRLTKFFEGKAIFTPEFLLYYRIHTKQMSHTKWYSMFTSGAYIVAREILESKIEYTFAKRILRRFLVSKFFFVPDFSFKLKLLLGAFITDPLGLIKDEVIFRMRWRFFPSKTWAKPNIKAAEQEFMTLVNRIRQLTENVIK